MIKTLWTWRIIQGFLSKSWRQKIGSWNLRWSIFRI